MSNEMVFDVLKHGHWHVLCIGKGGYTGTMFDGSFLQVINEVHRMERCNEVPEGRVVVFYRRGPLKFKRYFSLRAGSLKFHEGDPATFNPADEG